MIQDILYMIDNIQVFCSSYTCVQYIYIYICVCINTCMPKVIFVEHKWPPEDNGKLQTSFTVKEILLGIEIHNKIKHTTWR